MPRLSRHSSESRVALLPRLPVRRPHPYPPPRTPPTPRAATIAFFDLNATAPGSAITSLTVASRGAYGLAFTRLKNSPEVSKLNIGPNVTTVKVFWKLDSLVLTVAPSP